MTNIIRKVERYINKFEERATWGNDFTGPAYTSEEYEAYIIIKELYAYIRGGDTKKATKSVHRRVSTHIWK